jgi:peptidylprolyl isomerase
MKPSNQKRVLRLTLMSALLASVSSGVLAQAPAPQRPVAPPKPKAAAAAPVTQATPAAPSHNAARPAADGEIVARVGTTNVSMDELRDYIAAMNPQEQVVLAKNPALLSQAVRMLLANRLVLREVQAKKWEQAPGIAEKLERVRDSALVELYLQNVSTPPVNFPGDEDLQKVYDANRSAFVMPRQYQIAQIFVALPKEADKAAETAATKNLEEVQRKLKAPGADFAAVATEAGAQGGGNLGWVAETQIRPELRDKLAGLAKNAVSEPIRLDDGWHIMKMLDTKASYTRTLPEVHDQLVLQIRGEQAKQLRQAYLADLIKKNPPIINEIALSKAFGEQTEAGR